MLKLNLKTCLMVVTSLVSGLPIIAFLLWPCTSVYNLNLREVEKRHLVMAEGMAASLEYYRDDLIAAMETFAIDVSEGRALEAQPFIENLDFYHVCVVRKSDGVIVASYLGNDFPCATQLPEHRLAYSTSMVVDGKVTFGGLEHADGPPRVMVFVGLGEHFVQGAISLVTIKKMQSYLQFGETGHAVIVDRSGRVIAHPSAATEESREDLSAVPIVQAIMRGDTGVMQFFSPSNEEDYIGGYTTIPVADWGVMVAQSVNEVQKATVRFNYEVVWVLFVGFLGSLVIAFFTARSFEKRIKDIQDAVVNIAKGTHGARFDEHDRKINIVEFREMEIGVSAIVRKISASEDRYHNLFENVPVASREEDLSGIKRRIDALNCKDVAAFEQYLDAHPEFVVECSQAIEVIDANAASLALYEARNVDDINRVSMKEFKDDSLHFLRDAMIAMYKGETRDTREVSITSISGEVRHVIATWCVLPGYEQSFSRSLMTSVDVTEQVEAEKALHHAQKMEALGQLTGGIAHDFNNLLTVLGGNAELLALDSELDNDLVEPIQNAVKRGAELTQRLLAFSRKQTLKPQSINVLALAKEIGTILRRTLPTNIEIQIIADEETVFVCADPGQLEAALLNLAINARDAMPQGGVLELAFKPATPAQLAGLELQPGEYVVCSVTDNGEGMTDKTLNHAFEPFYTTKGVGKGSGLGLSMVYGFARQSNGTAKIKSVQGQGTTISLFLPQVIEAPEAAASRIPDVDVVKANGLRILVLEDDPEVLKYLERVLSQFGHTVLLAPTIGVAWTLIDDGLGVDLLISDVLLPGRQKGSDFVHDLRQRKPDCPVIFISGHPNVDEAVPDDGNTEWLTKPFSGQDLEDTIQRLLPPQAPPREAVAYAD